MQLPKLNSVSGLIAASVVSVSLLGVTLASPGLATVAMASTSGDLVSATNASRAAAGLTALQENSALDSVAQGWANKLAVADVLSHNPALQSQVTNWTDLGENVGMGPSVPNLEQAFMASPDHKANILDTNYTQVGVGTATSVYPGCNCQILWVVVDFRRPASAASVVAPRPPSPTAPAATHQSQPSRPAPPVHPSVAPTHTATARAVPAATTAPTATAQPSVTPAAPAAAAAQLVAALPATVPSGPAIELRAKVTDDSTTVPDASDPVSSVLNFASVLAALS